MKPSTQKIALILTALVIQANAQTKPIKIKKTTLDLTYGGILAGDASEYGWPAAFGYIWETNIAKSKQKFYVNFNSKQLLVGSFTQAWWGIECTAAKKCTVNATNPITLNINNVQVTTNTISAPLQFGKSGTLPEASAFYAVAGNPFDYVGDAGFGFGSLFWYNVRTAAKSKDPLSIKFTLKGQKTLEGNMIVYDRDIGNLNATLTLLSDPPKNPIDAIPLVSSGRTYSASYGITGATVTLPYSPPKFGTKPTPPENNIITLVKSTGRICIAPQLPYVFVAALDQDTQTQILDTYAATVCPDAKNEEDLKQKCTKIKSAPTFTFNIGKQKFTIKGNEWVYTYKTGTVGIKAIKMQQVTPAVGVFAPGAPCEGAIFALGRNFFTKYSLTIQSVDFDLETYKIGISPNSGGLGWLLWVIVIVVVVIAIAGGVFFFLRKGKGDENGGFSQPLNN